ncbi:MAG: hypothetical protein P1V36_11255, partial [Planctomycetota bacterium]|nr:hypothetical protein [Planctomycetota bacterium]
MSRDHAPLIPLATARRAAVRVLRALASSPDVLRLGVAGALRRMEPRVPAVSLYATTLEPDAEAARRIERTVAELDFVQDGCLEPDLPFTLQVLPEADVGTILAEPAPPAPGTLTMGDVRGAFHLHTTPGRGRYALARVAQRATEEGYAWAVVTVPTAEAAALDALRVEAEQTRREALAAEAA